MRHFHGLIFMGNGKHSEAECARLEARLSEAFNVVSGLQQGNIFASAEENAREQAEGDACLEDVVRDVAAALLGREVVFGEKLPYPPPRSV